MRDFKYVLLPTLVVMSLMAQGQNLPSLLLERDINSTFSILAYDEETQEWGIAVATNNICVGNSTIYLEPGVGGFSVIAETEPAYGLIGLQNLQSGKTVQKSILDVRDKDEEANYRQVSGIDARGSVFAFTGSSLKYWKGEASQMLGKGYVVMGNQLAEGVLKSMSTAFEKAAGTLAERLLASLVAGQRAGGQVSGKQSAAVVVKGTDNEWFNQIDLRVDNSKRPIEELQTLMNYHYGRIRLNQALYANRAGNKVRAKEKLSEAQVMLDGWTGMYPRVATANIIMDNEDAAVRWIKKGLAENPKWTVYLPAFYVLREHPELKSIIKPEHFSIKDWESAIGMLSNLGRELEVIEVAERLISDNVESSYLHFILGRSFHYEKEKEQAIWHLKKALKMDEANVEARNLLKRVEE